MDIIPLLRAKKPTLSFEFFPPKSEQASEELFEVVHDLHELDPAFVSVTYGAGGGTRERTHQVVQRILRETGTHAIPHLTCISHKEADISDILEKYAGDGVTTILALRGDPPRDNPDYDRGADDFHYASDLVAFIKSHSSGPFRIGIAGFPEGHPMTANRLVEMDNFKAKVEAGADYICTQLFFDNHDYFDYRERCEMAGIDLPIVAGIMPITSLSGMTRMAELAAGCRFPAKLMKALAKAGDDPDGVIQAGIDYATEQCQELIDQDVAGLHLYTLNKSASTRSIAQNLVF